MFENFKAGSKKAASGRKREVGIRELDSTTARMLNIPSQKKQYVPEDMRKLLQHIHEVFDLDDFTPMNTKYGPHSGISSNERLIRAYNFGLLRKK